MTGVDPAPESDRRLPDLVSVLRGAAWYQPTCLDFGLAPNLLPRARNKFKNLQD